VRRLGIFLLFILPAVTALAHPWPTEPESLPLIQRIKPPSGFARLSVPADHFGAWLRTLPIKPGRPPVHLYDGRLKGTQDAHFAVLDIDVGKKNLPQCADAVMRLRAEYLWAAGREADIRFRFSNGEPAPWSRWKAGDRPHALGNKVWWTKGGAPRGGYGEFRRYLDTVYRWAGTASLARELVRVEGEAEPGDVFILGGHPGHAVIVLDVAVDSRGRRLLLLAQSYMPAQEIHILRGPLPALDPWYPSPGQGSLETPEWDFDAGSLRRFPGL